jgi:transposase InsO family protein
LAGGPGKRGRADELSINSSTRGTNTEQQTNFIENTDTFSPVTTIYKSNVVNLFSIDANGEREEKEKTEPFIHQVRLHGPQGEIVRVRANIDDGAMKEVMSSAMFRKVKHRLGTTSPSSQLLRVANGMIVESEARWEGKIDVNGISARTVFEVFDSGGKWDFLFGKTLLETFKAVHNYESDEITVHGNEGSVILRNQSHTTRRSQSNTQPPTTSHICVVTDETQPHEDEEPAEVDVDALKNDTHLFTRMTKPHKPERVQELLRLVTIGDDVNPEERQAVRQLISDFADIFALSVSEVKTVEDAIHHLDIPPDAAFSLKVHQKPLTPPQRCYLYDSIDKMLEAGVIEACKPEDVKCISATTLAQKTHQGKGHSLGELQHRVNDQCVANGMDPRFDLPPRTSPTPEDTGDNPKWRICQNFSQVNKITKVAPMPQGDIRAKQQRLSGHRWVSGFDFAAGFYAVIVDPESRPYTAFYVEGRGYFWYKRMPFGLTGAPSMFANMTAKHLYDLLSDGTMELLVDDGGAAADTFEEMMGKLTRIFTRIRESNLSLSASKCSFFMSQMVFAGASVGQKGVQPDLKKLTAIVNWKTPENATALAGFLGLTGWFRDLIRGYAKKEQPLRDLLRNVELPEKYTKTTYRRIMSNFKLKDIWTDKHTKAFLDLKVEMTSEPVLRGPRWDGSPFIITTDGCQDAFGAVLSQRSEYTLPSGKVIRRLHPLGFASKRTSKTEEKYKPFLLEFAALKFGLDKFADITWGFPIEVETDCQALRDHLLNDKLSATHARWRDGILAHQITDIRHVPGKLNVVADGLSRASEGTENEEGDGSGWTVSEDWEANVGLTHDIFYTTEATSPEVAKLRERFKDEPIFAEVIDAMLELDHDTSLRQKKRARHRASEYMIEDGRLWRVAGGHSTRAKSRVECITREEASLLAKQEHENNGHWQRDSVKKSLLDRIWSPGLDASIVKGITNCGTCKNFGGTHLHALLDPITRRHPLELLVGDYLSLPAGKGGYHTVGLYLDTFSQHVFGYKYKTAGSAKTTTDSLSRTFQAFAPWETFMSDGGKHFDNKEVRELCNKWGTKTHIVAAYSPWVNGLVEGTNKLFLHILKRLCAPDLDDEDARRLAPDDIPKHWPDHFEEAIQILNWRLLPSLKFSPKELMLGLVVNTKPTDLNPAFLPTTEADTALQMAYVAQQRLDGYAEAVAHAIRRKGAFDKKVLAQQPGEVVFSKGDLVQIYRSDLDYTFKTEHKLLPKWSIPHRIKSRHLNSYVLESLNGDQLPGSFSARRLRRFLPKEGTMLAEEQKAFEGQDVDEDQGEKRTEVAGQQQATPTKETAQDTTTTG